MFKYLVEDSMAVLLGFFVLVPPAFGGLLIALIPSVIG